MYFIYIMVVYDANISNKLWINSNIKNVKSHNSNSWFDIKEIEHNIINIYDYKYIKPDNIEEELRSRKVKILPNFKQRKILKEWMDIYRYVYNQTIKYWRKSHVSKYEVRKYFNNTIFKKKWISGSKIPKHTLDNAIFDVFKAIKTCRSLKKNGHINKYRIRYKKQNQNRSILKIEPSMFRIKDKFFTFCISNPSFSSGIKTEFHNEKFPYEINNDTILQYNKLIDEFYLFIPINVKPVKNKENMQFCSLDPGERTFLTGYSNNSTFEICTNPRNKFKNLLNRIDTTKNEKRRNKLRQRLKNKIDDLHYKTINWLISKYDNIIIGKISTGSIVQGNLPSKINRSIINLSHYLFRTRLEEKCRINNINLHIQDERYTSKTCGRCGYINNTLGGSKIFKCTECNINIDRDINGARNILMKHIIQCM
jgi:putative transposase